MAMATLSRIRREATISAGAYAVFLGGPGTVENLGSISGGSYAVDFSVNSSANLLQVGAGATFRGSVNGDGGAIELLSGGAGTIGGTRTCFRSARAQPSRAASMATAGRSNC